MNLDVRIFMMSINLFVVLVVFLQQIISVATTRKTLLFGVRVPEGCKKTKEARKITALYITLSIMSAIVFGLLSVLTVSSDLKAMFFSIMTLPFVMLAVAGIIYIISWKKAKKLKAEKEWVSEYAISVDTSFTDVLKTKIKGSRIWYVVSAIISAIAFVVCILYLPYAPEKLPTHWGPDGTADTFSDKSVMVFVSMFALTIGMLVLMYFSSFIMSRARLQKGGKYGAVTAQQGIKYKTMMINCLGYTCLLLTVLFAVMMLMSATIIPSPTNPTPFIVGIVVFLAAILIPIFYIMIKAGQSGEKLSVDDDKYVENTTRSITTANDDKLWKLGMFYFNKNDPALFVEPRFGSGTDFNYARPTAWIVVILTAVLIIGVIIGVGIAL